MRERLIQWLRCPVCSQSLALRVCKFSSKEIIEGFLRCQCGQLFPIIKGVPRLIPQALRQELPKLYPYFYERNIDPESETKLEKETQLNNYKKETISRFGYEWNHFSDYDCNNFEAFIANLPHGFFEDKLGLDIGCGAGRHSRQTSELGAEVVAIDISTAVDAAYYNNIGNDKVHVVQGDIYNLPFNRKIFDFIYSLGVLHHLPDPELGYQKLIPFLSDNGALFAWLYAHTNRKVALEGLRYISQRLSNTNIRRMGYLCNLIDYGIFINLYRLLVTLPIVGVAIKRHTPLRIKEYANYDFRVSYTDWFDRLSAPITNYYKKNEMFQWLRHSGLHHTKLHLEGDSWWWLYGERKI